MFLLPVQVSIDQTVKSKWLNKFKLFFFSPDSFIDLYPQLFLNKNANHWNAIKNILHTIYLISNSKNVCRSFRKSRYICVLSGLNGRGSVCLCYCMLSESDRRCISTHKVHNTWRRVVDDDVDVSMSRCIANHVRTKIPQANQTQTPTTVCCVRQHQLRARVYLVIASMRWCVRRRRLRCWRRRRTTYRASLSSAFWTGGKHVAECARCACVF